MTPEFVFFVLLIVQAAFAAAIARSHFYVKRKLGAEITDLISLTAHFRDQYRMLMNEHHDYVASIGRMAAQGIVDQLKRESLVKSSSPNP